MNYRNRRRTSTNPLTVLCLIALAVVAFIFSVTVLLPNFIGKMACENYGEDTHRDTKFVARYFSSSDCYVKVKGEWWSLSQVRAAE